MAGLILSAGVAAAQVDLAKVLVKEEGGKWVTDARLGGAEGGKTAKVHIDIDTSGSKPSLRFKGVSGIEYDVSLFNEKELVGTAVLTTSQAGRGSRDRSVKFEKKQ